MDACQYTDAHAYGDLYACSNLDTNADQCAECDADSHANRDSLAAHMDANSHGNMESLPTHTDVHLYTYSNA